MDRNQKLGWAAVRARGRLRYVIMRGVVYGGIMTVGSTLIGLLLSGHKPNLYVLAFRGLFFSLVGILTSLLIWKRNENDYRASK
jgi:hypothetical protein